jgi:PAS domain-containing protein
MVIYFVKHTAKLEELNECLKKEAEERETKDMLLNQANQDWEDKFNTITDIITIHDKDFNIIRANRAADEMLKLPAQELNKVIKCFRYYHGTDCPPQGCPSCDCLKTGKPATFELFEPHLKKFIEIRAIARFDENNHIAGLIHVVRDVSDRKKTEDALKMQKQNGK